MTRRFASQEHSAVLAQLASRTSAIMKLSAGACHDPLVKMKSLISDLISKLQTNAPSGYTSDRDEGTSKATEKEDLEADTAMHPYKVARDTCTKDNMVIAAGEITVAGKFHRETVVRDIRIGSSIDDLSSVDSKGLIYQDCEVLFHVNEQSPEFAGGVDVGKDGLDDAGGLRRARDETEVTTGHVDDPDESLDPRKIHTVVTHATAAAAQRVQQTVEVSQVQYQHRKEGEQRKKGTRRSRKCDGLDSGEKKQEAQEESVSDVRQGGRNEDGVEGGVTRRQSPEDPACREWK